MCDFVRKTQNVVVIITIFQSRGVYETPAGTILHTAHTDLEVFCLDKEVHRVKQRLRDKLSDYVYNGYWFSPEGSYVSRCIEIAQENVSGSVKLELHAGAGNHVLLNLLCIFQLVY